MRLYFYVCIIMFFTSPLAFADVIHIPADSTTITAGLSAASTGDTVLVAPGIYYEYNLILPSGVCLLGDPLNPESVCIDASNNGRVIIATGVAQGTELRGFHILQGHASSGGGIICDAAANPTIRNMVFTDCSTTSDPDNYGGALFYSASGMNSVQPIIEDCDFYNNSSSSGGGAIGVGNNSSPTITNCYFEGNTGSHTYSSGGAVHSSELCYSKLIGCRFVDNSSRAEGGAVGMRNGSYLELEDCVFIGNHAETGNGGAVFLKTSSSVDCINCSFDSNTAYSCGGGVAFHQGGRGNLIGCLFNGNESQINHGGAVYTWDAVNVSIQECAFLSNISIGGAGGAICKQGGGRSLIRSCSFWSNSAHNGSVLFIQEAGIIVEMEQCILAGNLDDMPIVWDPDNVELSISCTNISGNIAGDWIGNISIFQGINGNFSADPLFCDADIGNLTLQSNSPCLPGKHPDGDDCGLVGAFGIGCYTESPALISITDIPNDNGRQVRLMWHRSSNDEFGGDPLITEYGIYRQQDEYKGPPSRLEGWDFISTVPARGDDIYQFIAPTLCDSSAADGVCWSTFFVSAMTVNPHVFFDSQPDSGYSVDNIAPPPPENLVVEYCGWGNALSWEAEDRSSDPFTYRVYRGESPDTVDELVYECYCLSWSDSTGTQQHQYALTLVDAAGNESSPAIPAMVLDNDAPEDKIYFSASPNPAFGKTTLHFNLLSKSQVILSIFDSSGRLIQTPINCELPAGIHSVSLDLADLSIIRNSGIYWARLTIGSELSREIKLVITK